MTMNHFLADDPMRRRLLSYVILHDSQELQDMVADAASDVVSFADEEMLEDLIWPIFYYSSYCMKKMAADVLGLSTEEEYELEELLRLFEIRDEKTVVETDWIEDGF